LSSDILVSADLWRGIGALLLAAVVIMGSPGPSTVSATAVGAAFGIGRSLRYVAGLIAGTTAVLLAVAAGVVALVLAVPYGGTVLVVGSSIYILYLSWKIATAPPLREGGQAVSAPAFMGGFLLAIANPKAYLAIAAVFAGTTLFAGAPAMDAGLKIVLLTAMIVAIHFTWLLAGASLARSLRDPLISRVVNVVLAVLLAASAARGLLG